MKKDKGKIVLESMSELSWYNDWLLKKIFRYLSGDILEVGCGIGNFTHSLLQFGKVTAIDVDKEYISITKNSIKNLGNVGFGDIEKGKYFFKDKEFDSIICLNVLEHIEDDHKAAKNLIKLLKKGGYLIILVPSHPKLYGEIDKSIYHFRRYDKEKIEEMIKDSKIEIVKSQRLNLLGAIGWFAVGKVLKNSVIKKDNIRLFSMLGPAFLFLERFIKIPLGISVLLIARK